MSLNLLMLSGDRDVAAGRRGPFYDTLAGLAAEFAHIDVLTPSGPDMHPRSLHGHVRVHPSSAPRVLQAVWLVRKARALAARRRYHLIVSHDHGMFSNGMAALWLSTRLRTPYVSEIHHVPAHPKRAQWWEPATKLGYRLYARLAASRARAIRVVNRREVPDLLAAWGVPREKILVLPSAYIDRAIFAPNATPKRYALGFVGRLVANKNPRYLAAIIESIAAANTGARFVIVGRGREGERLRRRLELRGILGRVEMRPWVDGPAELAALYRQMDALVCTSLSEGGPRVCLEAMACGVPVFTTPVGLMPETVRDGANGWILPWDQVAGAELVRRVLADRPALQAAARAARAATEPFDRDRVLGAYAAAYRGLAEENLA